MRKTVGVLFGATLGAIIAMPAQAHTRHHHHPFHHRHHHGARSARTGSTYSGRPHAWCGWYMRQIMGVADAAYNLAAHWAHYGRPAEPHIGVIVVWRHHVGRIVGGSAGHWEVNSGNDGHTVRTRIRSVAGAIAFRERG